MPLRKINFIKHELVMNLPYLLVFLTSTDFNQRFRGFLVQSRQRADDATVLGTFDTTPLFGGPELARTSSCPVNPEVSRS